MSGSIRRLAATAALMGLLLAYPGVVAATITGGCTGEGHSTSTSANITTDKEWHLLSSDVAGGSGTAPGLVRAASVGAYAFGIAIPIVSGTDPEGDTQGSVDDVSLSLFALLGHRFVVSGSGTGEVSCSGQIEIIIDDVNPLFTVLGGGGALLALIGYLLVLRTLRGGHGIFKRILDAIYGVIGGIGLALAGEQFGYLDPTQLTGLFIVIGSGLFGFLTAGLFGGGKKKIPPSVGGTAAVGTTPAPLGAQVTPDPGPLPDPGPHERPSGEVEEYPGSEPPRGGGSAT